MKYLLSLLLPFFLIACAPSKQMVSFMYPSPFIYKIIDTTLGTKNDLFVRAQEWVVKNYYSSDYPNRMADKDAGKLVARGSTTYQGNNWEGSAGSCISRISYTVTVDVKDNRYRCELSDFKHDGCGNRPSGGNLDSVTSKGVQIDSWLSIKNAAKEHANKVLSSFQNTMQNANPKDDGF